MKPKRLAKIITFLRLNLEKSFDSRELDIVKKIGIKRKISPIFLYDKSKSCKRIDKVGSQKPVVK